MNESFRFLFPCILLILLASCNNQQQADHNTATDTSYAATSYINSDPADSSIAIVSARSKRIDSALAQPVPVLFLQNIDNNKALAQIIASNDPRFRETLFDKASGKPYLNEVFNIYAARPQEIPAGADASSVYRVEMYNYALNLTTVSLVDISAQQVIAVNTLPQTQPDL
ncbi:MAG: hypothetical protein ABI480_10975, partial [Chitinophagaceae bacterium]